MSKKCAIPKSKLPVKFKVESPRHALELARGLIRPFRHWTIGALAVDGAHVKVNKGNEDEISVKSVRAEAFCALGALLRVNTKHATKAEKFLSQAAGEVSNRTVESWNAREVIFGVNDNNGRTKEAHAQVLAMFKRAIALARAAQK